MLILGLTGSIGMGKSTAAGMLIRRGYPVHDADSAVHRMMAAGGAAVTPIEAAFPGTVRGGAVDRKALGQLAFGDAGALRRLEAIIHPLVRVSERRFLLNAARRRVRFAVLDIPLLFETGAERRMDATILLTAPARVQRARVLRRPGMTGERLDAILAQQMPDAEKRKRADFIVPTGLGRRVTRDRLADVLGRLQSRKPAHWPPNAYRLRKQERKAGRHA